METFFAIGSTVGWVGAIALLVIYHRTARWWRTGYGRALFVLIIVSFSFFTTSMFYNLLGPDYPGRTFTRILNMVLSVSMIWYLLVTMIVEGARVRKERRRHLVDVMTEEI